MIRALLISLFTATTAPAATVDMTAIHPGDPETLWMQWDTDTGRVSFRKPGDYLGGKIGCDLARVVKDIRQDRVARICKPLSVNASQGVAAPEHYRSAVLRFGRETYSLSADSFLIGLCRCSSVVEQWSPKPHVGGSIPSTFASPETIPSPPSLALLLTACAGLLFRRRA